MKYTGWKIKLTEKGYTLIPVSLFINENGLAKIIIGLAKGRRAYEKRDKIKARDADREMDRAMRR